MATGGARPGTGTVQLTIRYNSQRLTVYVSPDDRADTIIRKAAASLQEDVTGLQLLYQGTPVPDDATVKVSFLNLAAYADINL